MMKLCTTLILILAASTALAQPEVSVQIADQQTDGVWTNWTALTVTLDDTALGALPPHNPRDDDAVQDWYLPYNDGFWHFSFERATPGTYAIRWCVGAATATSLFSLPAECTIELPQAAVHR